MSSLKSLIHVFENFDFGEVTDNQKNHKNYNQPVHTLEFLCGHPEDFEPMTLIMPNINGGPWIAGGACLKWYQGLPVGESDIDVFCADQKQVELLVEQIKSYGSSRYHTKFESENAITMSYYSKDKSKNWTIQIIKKRFFNSLQEVIDNFDITVCQIGTGGEQWLLGPTTAKDINQRTLRMRKPLQPDAVKRLVKYWTYGYIPVEGLIEEIQNQPNLNWKFEIDGDYNNAF